MNNTGKDEVYLALHLENVDNHEVEYQSLLKLSNYPSTKELQHAYECFTHDANCRFQQLIEYKYLIKVDDE